ncbi:MAG TPA: lytic transglycosylase domain-containing protein [Bacteroidales bacterium]|nr:lytic transglycosylase domain-containing protein [Bacteroidales bacterium]
MSKGKFSSWLFPVIYFTGAFILAGTIFSVQSFTGSTTVNNIPLRMPSLAQSFTLPDQIEFAGEIVPQDNFDTRESLDKELLVNGYWHSRTLMVLKRSKRHFEVIEPVLKKFGVPDDFKYLAMAESGFENVVSPAKAVGVWQILESTAREYGLEVNADVDERYHLEKSTEVACKYLLDSYKRYGNWIMAAAAYNAGRSGMDKQIAKQKTENYFDLLLNEETARYVFRLIAHKLIVENPAEFGFQLDEEDYYPVLSTHEITVDSAISDIAVFALSHSTNYKIIKQLNPWLRQNYLPDQAKKVYTIKMPEEGERSVRQSHESIPEPSGETN